MFFIQRKKTEVMYLNNPIISNRCRISLEDWPQATLKKALTLLIFVKKGYKGSMCAECEVTNSGLGSLYRCSQCEDVSFYLLKLFSCFIWILLCSINTNKGLKISNEFRHVSINNFKEQSLIRNDLMGKFSLGILFRYLSVLFFTEISAL
jgi:hypothetical protein